MDLELPADLAAYLVELDEFIEREIKPLEEQDDNVRFFDHRREDARTDWDRGGLPSREWEELLAEARRRADAAGHYRYPFPPEFGGRDGSNLDMAVIREHLATQGPRPALRPAERARHRRQQRRAAADAHVRLGRAEGRVGRAPGHRDAATSPSASPNPSTAATPRGWRPPRSRTASDWVINGEKTWNTGIHTALADLIFARTSGQPGDGDGHHRVPRAGRTPRLPGRGVPVDVQHADRPRPRSRCTTCGCRTRRSSVGRAGACRWCSTSSTRTASARPRRAWAPRSSASTSRWPTPRQRAPFGKPLATQPGHPVPAGRAADRSARCCAR